MRSPLGVDRMTAQCRRRRSGQARQPRAARRRKASSLTRAQPSTTHEEPNPVRLFRGNYTGRGVANRVSLASLAILEAPAPEVLRERGERDHYRAFRRMTEGDFAAFAGGNAEAIAAMIDSYGGAGTYASWPPRVRAYVCRDQSGQHSRLGERVWFCFGSSVAGGCPNTGSRHSRRYVGAGWPARRHHLPPQVLPPWLSRQARTEGLQLRYRRGDNHFEQRCLVRYSLSSRPRGARGSIPFIGLPYAGFKVDTRAA